MRTSQGNLIGGVMALTESKNSVKKVEVDLIEEDWSLNEVKLRGRVSAKAIEKELPSGDKVVEFRLIVTRTKQAGVDTLDIAAWSAKSRRAALSLAAGQWIQVSGAIHRRFWTSPMGLASRWQVEALEISRI